MNLDVRLTVITIAALAGIATLAAIANRPKLSFSLCVATMTVVSAAVLLR